MAVRESVEIDLDRVDGLIQEQEAELEPKHRASIAYREIARRHVAGGVASSWQASPPHAIFIERGIQSLVKDSFNAPIVPTRLEQGFSRPDGRIGTGDEWPGLAGGFAFVHRPTLELADLGRRHKADLFRISVLEPKVASFLPAAIALLAFGDFRQILRGEMRGPGEVRTRSYEVLPGWF